MGITMGATIWFIIGYVFIALAVVYTSIAGFVYMLLYVWRAKILWSSKIQQWYPERKHIIREIWYSISSLLMFGAVLVGVAWATAHGYTRAYEPIDKLGWGYFIFSVIYMIFLHDAYFYWTHRLLHWKPLFKSVHIKHHLSINPTPFAALAFHPLEAFLQISIVPLVAFIFPHHFLAIQIGFVYSLVMNIAGHMGYETLSESFINNKILRWHNTSTHHNMHHRLVKYNYGLYFNIWDRLMGTNHPDYEKEFEKVTDQRKKGRKARFNKKMWAKRNKQRSDKPEHKVLDESTTGAK